MLAHLNINIKQITEDGMVLATKFPSKDMELDYINLTATGNVSVDLMIVLVSKEIIVQGKIKAQYKSECDRCLKEVKIPVTINNIIITYDYKGEDFIDISPEIRDEILLALPTKVLCREDCRGLCPGCKVDLNTEKCRCGQNSSKNNPFEDLNI